MTYQEALAAITSARIALVGEATFAAEKALAEKEIVADTNVKIAKAFKPKPCQRCNGEGKLSCFNHVAGGVCFACNGTGNKYNG